MDAPAPPARRPRPWMVIAGGSLVLLVIAAILLSAVLPGLTTRPSTDSKPTPPSQATARPTDSATAMPSPAPSQPDAAADAEAEDVEAPVAAPAAPAPAAPPPPAPPVAPAPPVLPPPPPPIITPTITTFTATNFNDKSQTIAQGCAASPNGELAVRITWATANANPSISFRTQISGTPKVDSTITGYSTSGENHYVQLRCAKIAYVTMTLHSDTQERQARLTIDGNGSAGWSYLS